MDTIIWKLGERAVDAQRSVTERCQMGNIPNSEVKDSCVRELGSSNALDIGLLAQKLPLNGFGHRIWARFGEAAKGLLEEVEHWGVDVQEC